MAKRTKYEKETIILFNEGEDTASIYTFNAGLGKRLAAFSRKYPDLCRLEQSHEQGGVSYVLDKSRLSIRFLPPYSEEHRKKASECARQNGFNSQAE
ncbi:MAG: molecular chaperone [Butyricicoccus pullicaecorum]|nr:molecular chaperone [Butyricicoccus pullicaecorum]